MLQAKSVHEHFSPVDNEYSVLRLENLFRTELVIKQQKGVFSEQEVSDILRILEVVREGHAGRFRQEKNDRGEDVAELYHLLDVALAALRHGESVMVVCAALLHDYREDSSGRFLARDTLKNLFSGEKVCGTEIEELVYLLTNTKLDIKMDVDVYYQKIRKRSEAIRIKAYDRLSNLRSFGRMLVKTRLQSDFYTESLREKLSQRVLRNIGETQDELLPILRSDSGEIITEMMQHVAANLTTCEAESVKMNILTKHRELAEELEDLILAFREEFSMLRN